VLDLLGQLYSERTHFIFELIQNAEDAGATEMAFELHEDRLELRHDGRPFTEADVRGVCGVGQSGKRGDYTAIGQFGIGFKSVYAYTRSPRIYSGDEHFRIENYVRPVAAPPLTGPTTGPGTRFVFPFDHDEVPAATAAAEISAALAALAPRTLLFLRNVTRLDTGGTVLERSVTQQQAGTGRRVTLARDGRREEWLVWERPAQDHPGQRVEIAFRVQAGRLASEGRSPLTVFFPTDKETFLGFVVQGPYRTTPARDNVPEHDPDNQALAGQTAALLAGVLRELRDLGQLTVEVLTALPLEPDRFPPGSLLRPLYDAVRDELAAGPLIPTADGGYTVAGGYAVAGDLALTTSTQTAELLGPDQLGALFGASAFAHRAIGPESTPALWRYLTAELELTEVTPSAVVARADGDFLAAQPDEWMARFYGYLDAYPSAGREARDRPVIRLEDGRQVTPFDGQGRPAVYLPGPGASAFPTVRRAVAGDPVAGPFLASLGLTEPDVVAEVLQLILPRYRALEPTAAVDLAQHDADLATVIRAVDEAAGGRREELLEQLRETAFLIAENAATGEHRLMPPPALYQRSVNPRGLPRRQPGRLVRGRHLRALAGAAARDGRAAAGRGPGAEAERVGVRAGHGGVRPQRTRPRRVRPGGGDRRPGLRAEPPQPRQVGIRVERPAGAEPAPDRRGGGTVGARLVQRGEQGDGPVGDRAGRGAPPLAARPGRCVPAAQ